MQLPLDHVYLVAELGYCITTQTASEGKNNQKLPATALQNWYKSKKPAEWLLQKYLHTT